MSKEYITQDDLQEMADKEVGKARIKMAVDAAMVEVVGALNAQLERLSANMNGVGGHERHTQEETAAEQYKRMYGSSAAQATAQGTSSSMDPMATALGAAGMKTTERAQMEADAKMSRYETRFNERGLFKNGAVLMGAKDEALDIGSERRASYIDSIMSRRKVIDRAEAIERADRKRAIDYQVRLGYISEDECEQKKRAIDKEYADLEPTIAQYSGMAQKTAIYESKFYEARGGAAQASDAGLTGKQWAKRLADAERKG